MSSPEETTRAEKIMHAMLRSRFLDSLPKKLRTLINFRAFYEICQARSEEYRNNSPFPHIVIDDFLPQKGFEVVYGALPSLDDPDIKWGNLTTILPDGRTAQARKYHLDNYLYMHPLIRQLIAEMNSGPFTFMLSELTGIHGLISDALLQGAGVHMVERGGLLRVHADFRMHPNVQLDRRLNLLLYMNPDWKEEYGGHLELWNKTMTRCEKRILPVANRCVIFSTSADSYHGHPHPLTCPQGEMRKSIALYYFTARPAPRTEMIFGTDWQDLPNER